ncbi:MAG: hypothetical protein HZA04_03335 [Nitrospinae bacterium]|nr:hypothetical protein [Nitrospinota bacterium]
MMVAEPVSNTRSIGDPLLEHLKGQNLVCPFSVSAHRYSIHHELPINTFCWFMAEKNAPRIKEDPALQLLAGCAMAGVYRKCAVYHSVREV